MYREPANTNYILSGIYFSWLNPCLSASTQKSKLWKEHNGNIYIFKTDSVNLDFLERYRDTDGPEWSTTFFMVFSSARCTGKMVHQVLVTGVNASPAFINSMKRQQWHSLCCLPTYTHGISDYTRDRFGKDGVLGGSRHSTLIGPSSSSTLITRGASGARQAVYRTDELDSGRSQNTGGRSLNV